MTSNEPGAQEALDLLLQNLRQRDPNLEELVRSAIDAGHEVQETQLLSTRRGMKSRGYRRLARFTYQEALDVALQVLRAHFVELPLIINSAVTDFAQASVTVHGDQRALGSRDSSARAEKHIEIEVQTETSISPSDREPFELKRIPEPLIREQQDNLSTLSRLLGIE